jgi:hypothetical protein
MVRSRPLHQGALLCLQESAWRVPISRALIIIAPSKEADNGMHTVWRLSSEGMGQ